MSPQLDPEGSMQTQNPSVGNQHKGSVPPPPADAAIAWASAHMQSGYTKGKCLEFVRRAFGLSAKYPSASAAWAGAADKHNDAVPPAGVPVFFSDHNPNGHVAISIGNGYVISTDISGDGTVSVVPMKEIEQKWGATYEGWTTSLEGQKIQPAPAGYVYKGPHYSVDPGNTQGGSSSTPSSGSTDPNAPGALVSAGGAVAGASGTVVGTPAYSSVSSNPALDPLSAQFGQILGVDQTQYSAISQALTDFAGQIQSLTQSSQQPQQMDSSPIDAMTAAFDASGVLQPMDLGSTSNVAAEAGL